MTMSTAFMTIVWRTNVFIWEKGLADFDDFYHGTLRNVMAYRSKRYALIPSPVYLPTLLYTIFGKRLGMVDGRMVIFMITYFLPGLTFWTSALSANMGFGNEFDWSPINLIWVPMAFYTK